MPGSESEGTVWVCRWQGHGATEAHRHSQSTTHWPSWVRPTGTISALCRWMSIAQASVFRPRKWGEDGRSGRKGLLQPPRLLCCVRTKDEVQPAGVPGTHMEQGTSLPLSGPV